MKKETYFELVGLVVVTGWLGQTGWVKLIIHTDQAGLNAIKKEPLQDYISFGVQSVNYAYFEVYQIDIYHKKNKTIKIDSLEPIDTIEAGKFPEKLNKPEFDNDYYNSEPVEINY